MSFKIDIHPAKTLRIIYSGKITGEEIHCVRENAKAMVRANELEKIFCDLRDALLDVKKIELFNLAASQKKRYKNIVKTAILYKPDIHDKEDLLVYASEVSKKGFKVRLFTNRSEALKWLKF
jgi:hypothetical protein